MFPFKGQDARKQSHGFSYGLLLLFVAKRLGLAIISRHSPQDPQGFVPVDPKQGDVVPKPGEPRSGNSRRTHILDTNNPKAREGGGEFI